MNTQIKNKTSDYWYTLCFHLASSIFKIGIMNWKTYLVGAVQWMMDERARFRTIILRRLNFHPIKIRLWLKKLKKQAYNRINCYQYNHAFVFFNTWKCHKKYENFENHTMMHRISVQQMRFGFLIENVWIKRSWYVNACAVLGCLFILVFWTMLPGH